MFYICRWRRSAVISIIAVLVQTILVIVPVTKFVMMHVIYFTTLQRWNLSLEDVGHKMSSVNRKFASRAMNTEVTYGFAVARPICVT